MGFGVGLLLTAAGAILAWAVNAPSSTVNVHAVGYVLLAVGLIGMSVSLAFWNSWGGPGSFVRSRRTVRRRGRPQYRRAHHHDRVLIRRT
jgi:hypothetical protein